MSFLTPFYLLGLAAVSLPVLFHLIRRTPRGRYAFSSLMFLSPSPPRLTRRSRIENLPLLLLRAAALILLAAAFARPFLRSNVPFGSLGLAGRKVALLVDRSASMRREGIWPQVVARVDEALEDLGPGDDLALYGFDARHEVFVGFDAAAPADLREKTARVRAALASATPGWGATDLGRALIAVADEIDQAGGANKAGAETIRQIVLITDLQEGSRLESLRTYQWPGDVELAVRRVVPAGPTNAGLHLAADSEQVAGEDLRVRVTNSRDSLREQFSLHWEDDSGRAGGEPIRVYTPVGESCVIRVPLPPTASGATRLVLAGDDQPFDNTLYHLAPRQEAFPLLYLGGDGPGDPAGLRYYLERALPETRLRKVILTARRAEESLTAADLDPARMVVARESISESRLSPLQDYLKKGGSLLVVLGGVPRGPALAGLLGLDRLEVEEASSDDYALLGELDFSDPLFAPFADPRYNDFTKIHFWKHRRVKLPGDWQGKVLARFDNGDPAILEAAVGNGRFWVFASGWQPADSQLARSTKFVPLLSVMLERSAASGGLPSRCHVGQAVALPPAGDKRVVTSVRRPSGAELKLPAGAALFDETTEPGVYLLSQGDRTEPFAVNLSPDESKTAALSADQLGLGGISLGPPATRKERIDRARQIRDAELESRQKVWRWLIAAAVGILILETWLAGRMARRALETVETG